MVRHSLTSRGSLWPLRPLGSQHELAGRLEHSSSEQQRVMKAVEGMMLDRLSCCSTVSGVNCEDVASHTLQMRRWG